MATEWIYRLRPYAGWAALVLLVAGLFSGLNAARFAFPLTLFVAAAGFACFRFWAELKTFDIWMLDEWARARYEAFGVQDWRAPHNAAEIYCSQVVVKTRNEAAAEMNTIMMELIRNQERIAVGSSVDFGDPRSVAPSQTDRNAKYDAAQVRYNQCNAALAREILAYLVRGDLLAKGLPTANDIARAERIIPTARWRVMSLDIAKAKASGAGFNYSGLVIGRKPTPRKPAPAPSAEKPAVKAQEPPRQDAPPRPPRPTT